MVKKDEASKAKAMIGFILTVAGFTLTFYLVIVLYMFLTR